MSTKHTPGPWRVGDAGHAVFGPKGSGMYPNAPVTVVKGLANKANARLIAAAPDLLNALEEFILDIPESATNDYYTMLFKRVVAKARGES